VEYVFDGLDPVAEYDMLNGQRDNYYRGALNRIATRQHFPAGAEGQMYWYHYNFKGDVVGLTKHHGQSTHNYRYDPYGGVVPARGNWTAPHNHYTLTGKEYDEHTELVYFGARHYDPMTAVWQTQDTFRGIALAPQSIHRYGYVYGDPISYYDPYGYWPKFLDNALQKAGNFVNEHKEEIVRGAAIAGAVGLGNAVTVLTAGAAPLAIAATATVAGAAGAGAATIGANRLVGREWKEDLVENTMIGGSIGLGIGTAGIVAPGAATWASGVGNAVGALTGSSTIGTVASSLLTTGYVGGTGMVYSGGSLSINPLVSERTPRIGEVVTTAGLTLQTGSYAIGESIKYYGSYAQTCSRNTETPTERARRLGQEGEVSEGITESAKRRIPSLTGTARYRIPDAVNPETQMLKEVKNVQYQSYTSQIRDYVAYSKNRRYTFELVVRQDTQLSGPLEEAIRAGDIILKRNLP